LTTTSLRRFVRQEGLDTFTLADGLIAVRVISTRGTEVRIEVDHPDDIPVHATPSAQNPHATPSAQKCYMVLAGNFKEAIDWARSKGLPGRPAQANGWVYAASVHSIRGRIGYEVVEVGTFWNRNDSPEMSRAAEAMNRHGIQSA